MSRGLIKLLFITKSKFGYAMLIKTMFMYLKKVQRQKMGNFPKKTRKAPRNQGLLCQGAKYNRPFAPFFGFAESGVLRRNEKRRQNKRLPIGIQYDKAFIELQTKAIAKLADRQA